MYPTVQNIAAQSNPLMEKLKSEKKSALEFSNRRYENWNENYELFRNKVKTNRLTQRQEVNIPLMKETIKTLLSRIDDAPIVDWKELAGDEMKEIIFQEVWNDDFDKLNLEGIDIQDKKSCLLYGRAFKKLNWIDNKIDIRALDIFDVVVDPLTDPLNIETARFIIQQNIFRSLRDILADERYNTEGKEKLKIWLSSPSGIIQSSKDKQEWEFKLERLKAMGVDSSEFPLFAGGDSIVNLTEHCTNLWNEKEKKFERRVIVYANDSIELMNEKLIDLIGVEFYPFITWAEDIETQDFWSDSVADLIRVPNKVINIWFSQLVENRTIRNFQMHWYDATVEGYAPQTYEPGAGRMLPAPGDPNKTIMPVDVSGLDETMNAIQFLTNIMERASGATAIEKGTPEKGVQTLGEIQILVGKAQERTVTMAKAYKRSWKELCQKYQALMKANATNKRELFKKGSNNKMWSKIIYPSDWQSEAGYEANITSGAEHEESTVKNIQKFQFILQQFPNNGALRKIAQKKMLEIIDLSAEEMEEISKAEEEVIKAQQQAMMSPEGQNATPQADSVPSPIQLSQLTPQA